MSEYDSEPVRGLPEALPPGETILWQGAPDWKNVAQRTMHVRSFTVYFALLLAWYAGSNIARQTPAAQVLLSTGKLTLCAVLAVGLLAFFAWMVGRTTLYTVTNKRLVIRCGIALPMILNIPFSRVASADFKACRDGSGDIVLSLTKENRIAYLALWPHARPWRLAHAQPMLRGIQEASIAAQVLGRALAAAASVPAKPLPETTWETSTSGNTSRPSAAMA